MLAKPCLSPPGANMPAKPRGYWTKINEIVIRCQSNALLVSTSDIKNTEYSRKLSRHYKWRCNICAFGTRKLKTKSKICCSITFQKMVLYFSTYFWTTYHQLQRSCCKRTFATHLPSNRQTCEQTVARQVTKFSPHWGPRQTSSVQRTPGTW